MWTNCFSFGRAVTVFQLGVVAKLRFERWVLSRPMSGKGSLKSVPAGRVS